MRRLKKKTKQKKCDPLKNRTKKAGGEGKKNQARKKNEKTKKITDRTVEKTGPTEKRTEKK